MKLGSEMRKGVRDITLASRIFLALAVVSLVVAVVLLAYQQGAFTKRIQVFFIASSADGMNKGMAVKLVGFKVGSVESISIDRDLRVRVELRIDAKYGPMVDADAAVRLTREAIIGSNVLEIRPGSGDKGQVKDKAILRYEREPSVESQLTALLDQIAPIVGDVRQITAYLSAPDSDLRQAIRNVNQTTARLATASADLKGVMASAMTTVEGGGTRLNAALDTTNALMRDAHSSVATLDGTLKKIDTALPGIMSKMDQSLENIRLTTEAARGMFTGDLPGLVGDAGTAVSDIGDVVHGVKRGWPVSSMVQPAQERLLRLDSGGGLTAVPADGARER